MILNNINYAGFPGNPVVRQLHSGNPGIQNLWEMRNPNSHAYIIIHNR